MESRIREAMPRPGYRRTINTKLTDADYAVLKSLLLPGESIGEFVREAVLKLFALRQTKLVLEE
jgi:hypothetical protein